MAYHDSISSCPLFSCLLAVRTAKDIAVDQPTDALCPALQACCDPERPTNHRTANYAFMPLHIQACARSSAWCKRRWTRQTLCSTSHRGCSNALAGVHTLIRMRAGGHWTHRTRRSTSTRSFTVRAILCNSAVCTPSHPSVQACGCSFAWCGRHWTHQMPRSTSVCCLSKQLMCV